MHFITHFITISYRRHCDANVLSYQSARMPEQIRLKVGGISSAQFSVYDEFARNIPGFQPMTERDAALFIQKTAITVSEVFFIDFNFLQTLITNTLFLIL